MAQALRYRWEQILNRESTNASCTNKGAYGILRGLVHSNRQFQPAPHPSTPFVTMCLAELLRPALACPFLYASILTAGELKVDINRDGKNSVAQTATGYTQWTAANAVGTASNGTTAITRSFPIAATGETVTVALSMTAAARSAGGTGLTYTYNSAGSLAEGTKLVSDGITVEPSVANAGGQIQMTLTGLAAGAHSLLTFHNAGDSPAQLVSMAPVKAYMNDVLVATVMPSIRSSDIAAPTAYFTFTTTSPGDVTTFLFESDATSAAVTKNVVLNGFEIDTSNSIRMAGAPSPTDGSQQVDSNAGGVTLSWASASTGGAVSHDIYFGTSASIIKAATRAASVYIGNQTGNSRVIPVTDPNITYYWRIDEMDALGNITVGAIWSFRLRPSAIPDADGYGQAVFVCLGGKDKRPSIITIPPPGRGWNYSAVAPVIGERWNRILRTDGVDVTDATIAPATTEGGSKLGVLALKTATNVPLVDPAGKPTRVKLTIQIEVKTLATDKPRSEPTIHGKSKEALPVGLMDTAWRVFLPNNALRFTLSGLVPGQPYDLYGYAGALDPAINPDGANDGARFTLTPQNIVAGTANTSETTGGFCASIQTYNPEADKISMSPIGSNWVRLSTVADSKGLISFTTTRNSNGRHFVNGFQLIPHPKP
ncbi:MAG: hypothetical protein RIQ79_1712 [Verrucomicrobiota bacterium]